MTITQDVLLHLYRASTGNETRFIALVQACIYADQVPVQASIINDEPEGCPKCQRSDADPPESAENKARAENIAKARIAALNYHVLPDADPPHRIAPLNHKAVPGDNVPPQERVDELRRAWVAVAPGDTDVMGNRVDVNARYR